MVFVKDGKEDSVVETREGGEGKVGSSTSFVL